MSLSRVYPVQVSGDLVAVREFRLDDLDAVRAIVGDDRVTAWLSFERRTAGEARAMVEGIVERATADPRTEYYLAITRTGDDRVVGFTRLGLDGVEAAKLGYAIAAEHWGRGYATEAVRAMLRFGLGTLRLHRISAAIGPENQPSIAVAKRAGLIYEGRIRHHVRSNGGWRDSLLYSILEDDWRAAQQAGP